MPPRDFISENFEAFGEVNSRDESSPLHRWFPSDSMLAHLHPIAKISGGCGLCSSFAKCLMVPNMHITSGNSTLHILRHSPTHSTTSSVKCRHLHVVCFLLAVSSLPWSACAQFTDPRNYENSPVGVNQLELGYAYARSDTSIDPSIVIGGARLNLNQGTIGYMRYFGFFHRMAWIESSIPIAGLNGSLAAAIAR